MIAEEYLLTPAHYQRKFSAIMGRFLNIVSCWTKEEHSAFVGRLRAMPYGEFLQTPYWWMVRNFVVATRGARCCKCGESWLVRINVHHRTYEHRGEEFDHLEDLDVLCEECHSGIHAVKTKHERQAIRLTGTAIVAELSAMIGRDAPGTGIINSVSYSECHDSFGIFRDAA